MKTSVKIIHWSARVLCMLAILFVGMFAFDSFSPENNIWQNIGSLLMHLLPSFILLVMLLLAWKWELWGGIVLTVIGVAWSLFIFLTNQQRTDSTSQSLLIALILGFPFVLAGILFIVSHYLKNPRKLSNNE